MSALGLGPAPGSASPYSDLMRRGDEDEAEIHGGWETAEIHVGRIRSRALEMKMSLGPQQMGKKSRSMGLR